MLQQSHVVRLERTPEFWAAVDDDHRRIADFVAARDADAAATATREHLHRLRDLYVVTDDAART